MLAVGHAQARAQSLASSQTFAQPALLKRFRPPRQRHFFVLLFFLAAAWMRLVPPRAPPSNTASAPRLLPDVRSDRTRAIKRTSSIGLPPHRTIECGPKTQTQPTPVAFIVKNAWRRRRQCRWPVTVYSHDPQPRLPIARHPLSPSPSVLPSSQGGTALRARHGWRA